MNGKVIKVVIDHQEYLFKLSSDDEVVRLQELASKLHQRIQNNKRSVATSDYTKVLILTCLDLLEEINQSVPKDPSPPTIDEGDILKNLMRVHSRLTNRVKDS